MEPEIRNECVKMCKHIHTSVIESSERYVVFLPTYFLLDVSNSSFFTALSRVKEGKSFPETITYSTNSGG
jgi:hypothetical protein